MKGPFARTNITNRYRSVIGSKATIMSWQGDLIEFALKYDPQPFHADPDASKESPHGGLIAGGFHVLALGIRLLYETGCLISANFAGLGPMSCGFSSR